MNVGFGRLLRCCGLQWWIDGRRAREPLVRPTGTGSCLQQTPRRRAQSSAQLYTPRLLRSPRPFLGQPNGPPRLRRWRLATRPPSRARFCLLRGGVDATSRRPPPRPPRARHSSPDDTPLVRFRPASPFHLPRSLPLTASTMPTALDSTARNS